MENSLHSGSSGAIFLNSCRPWGSLSPRSGCWRTDWCGSSSPCSSPWIGIGHRTGCAEWYEGWSDDGNLVNHGKPVNHESLAASVNLKFVSPFCLSDLSEPCQEDGVPLAVSLRWKWLKLVETFQWVVAIVPLQTSKTPGKKQGTFRDLDVSYPRWMRKVLLVQWLKPGTWKPYRQSSGMNIKVEGNGAGNRHSTLRVDVHLGTHGTPWENPWRTE